MIPYWLSYSHWRYLLRYKLVGLYQRARYGWAEHDTWGYDHYLCQTMAPALRYMAANAHGYPQWILTENPGLTNEEGVIDDDHACRMWVNWLEHVASWMEWYDKEELNLDPGMTDDQKLAALDLWERQLKNFKEAVMVDFMKKFDSLWD